MLVDSPNFYAKSCTVILFWTEFGIEVFKANYNSFQYELSVNVPSSDSLQKR